MIDENQPAKYVRRYAYIATPPESGWYNGQTYVDTMSKEAMQKFIDITYEAYKEAVGESFAEKILDDMESLLKK